VFRIVEFSSDLLFFRFLCVYVCVLSQFSSAGTVVELQKRRNPLPFLPFCVNTFQAMQCIFCRFLRVTVCWAVYVFLFSSSYLTSAKAHALYLIHYRPYASTGSIEDWLSCLPCCIVMMVMIKAALSMSIHFPHGTLAFLPVLSYTVYQISVNDFHINPPPTSTVPFLC